MKTETYPLPLPQETLEEIRELAKQTGLSMADIMRKGLKLGLPRLREQFPAESPLDGLKPFTPEEHRQAFERPNPEFDALEHHCASLGTAPAKFEDQ